MNSPESHFCIECGRQLFKPAHSTGTKARTAPDERRQLTVMFCDLVDSTSLSGQIDPEDLREVIRRYQTACAQVVDRYEGHIAQYLGDGILVYFGYPRAHENDARRAVSSGLGIIAAIDQMNKGQELLGSAQLKVRVVIHTGLVVVGEMGAGKKFEKLALGDTPNIAARIEGFAPPDTVIISDATYRLIKGFFQCRNLGAPSLKGISKPITLYQVLMESAARSRLDVAETAGLTPLVGREQEVDMMFTHWEQAKSGKGRVVLLHGEPGIGKSRLVIVLKEYVSKEPDSWLVECHCSPFYRNSAFYPIIDLFERVLLSYDPEDSSMDKLRKLEGFLVKYDLAPDEMVPLFSSLLSIPLGGDYKPPTLAPERQKQKTIEAIISVLLKQAEQQPVLLVVENIHWIDPSTMELIDLIIDQEPASKFLTLLTFRPEFIPRWGVRSHLFTISLGPLPRQQSQTIVEHITGGKALPNEVLEQIIQKTDGVPLFVEELTKMVLESDLLREEGDRFELRGPLPPLAIPATLHDSLIARLDRLAEVKEVAQLGSTLGRMFSYELIQAVSSFDETVLQNLLGKLVSTGLLFQRGVPPSATYHFKHALIQDAAYESLLKSTRQQYNQRIAQVLEERFPQVAEAQPELVAQHYMAAGLNKQAIPFWQRAGKLAVERSANLEGIVHFTKGLEFLKALPDAPGRAQQELELQNALGNTLITIKGYGAPEVKQALERARELCRQVGETHGLFPVLHGLWVIYAATAEMQTARELAVQGLDLAKRLKDRFFLVEAHHAMGNTSFWCGEYISAKTHFEQGVALYDSQPYGSFQSPLSRSDPGLVCKSYLSNVLWLSGYPDKAFQMILATLKLAEELSHPYSSACVLINAALVHLSRGEIQLTHEKAESAYSIAEEHGFALWLAWSKVYLGWDMAAQGSEEEGISHIRQGIDFCQKTGLYVYQHFRILLSGVYGRAGKIEDGLAELAEAQIAIEKTGAGLLEAELYRTRGELLLMHASPDVEGAETEFRKAIDISRRKQAKSLELRATTSLSRFWNRQGKKENARNLLSEIYGWFTEGFDTADLKEAKALLDELS
jgi:class 3 adenylate cyclase/predicted ATPase